ncbi:MAG: DNA helicase RecQ [Clostridiales bacterium]|nr:DNA helicase RecQ [Clostridiales bacterium]
MTKHDILKQYFGHDSFRDGQEDLIDNIISGRDVLGIMPTGAGKSVCYQVPAMLLNGITVVISPLISLMKDQVRALVESGIPAAYINSSLSFGQLREVFRRASAGAYKIIYVAPERLTTDGFLAFAENTTISMVTVDEAHCVSQWGQDFRPSYLKIVEFIELLSYRPIISAFTATATKQVAKDISRILKLDNPYEVVTGFDRRNLYFEVIKPKHKFETLVDILNRDANRGKSGIIYCISRKLVEDVCSDLCERGFSATRYHAGLEAEERRRNQDDFLFDRKTVMVATNAFGMGIDKSNVSFVVHYNMPKDIESYYQEAGRAGRDGEPAQCTLLYSPKDVRTNKWLIENSEENEELSEEMRKNIRKKDLERLKMMTFYCTTYDCLRGFILKYFGERSPQSCNHCSNCDTNFENVDVTIEAQKIISCVLRLRQRGRTFGKNMIIDILRGSKNEKVLSWGLDSLSTYGIMSDTPARRIHTIFDYLIDRGCLSVDEDHYNTIRTENSARDILFGGKSLTMRMPKEKIPKIPDKPEEYSEVNEKLMARLKEVRMTQAKRRGVPAYVIFTDATLRDMCRIMPASEREFLEVSGVGEEKLRRYGEIFINEIKSFIKNNKE